MHIKCSGVRYASDTLAGRRDPSLCTPYTAKFYDFFCHNLSAEALDSCDTCGFTSKQSKPAACLANNRYRFPLLR